MAQVDSVHTVDGVDVHATRLSAGVYSAVPLQVLGSDAMSRLNVLTMSDALKHFAGITVRDYGGAGGMKTVAVRGIGSRHVAVVYDGLPVSEVQSGEIDLSRFSLDNMQQLALTVGDGNDVLLSARALASAASLSMRSMRSDWTMRRPVVRTGLMVGSWGSVKPSFFYGQTLSPGVRLSLLGDYQHADNNYPFTIFNGIDTHRERRNNSRMDAAHGELSLHLLPAQRQEMEMKAYYYDSRRQLPGIVRYYSNETDETLHDRHLFAQTVYDARLAGNWHLRSAYKFSWSESRYGIGRPTGGIVSSHYVQREHYLSAVVGYELAEHWQFSSATDGFVNALASNFAYGGKPFRRSLLEALQAKYESPRLTLMARLLLSAYFDRPGNDAAAGTFATDSRHSSNYYKASPSLSVSWRMSGKEQLYLRAFWKKNFRMPSFNELYFYHFGSPNVSPEHAQQFDVGITWAGRSANSGRRKFSGSGTLDLYINKVKDKILSVPFNMFVWHTMNLEGVTAVGIDFNGDMTCSLSPHHALALAGNYSWQHAVSTSEVQTGEYHRQIAYTPHHAFSLTLSWLNPWANISVEADGRSKCWTTTSHAPGTDVAGYVEGDVSLWRTFICLHRKATLKLSMLNVFDHQYAIVARYPMPGRSVRAALSVEW